MLNEQYPDGPAVTTRHDEGTGGARRVLQPAPIDELEVFVDEISALEILSSRYRRLR